MLSCMDTWTRKCKWRFHFVMIPLVEEMSSLLMHVLERFSKAKVLLGCKRSQGDNLSDRPLLKEKLASEFKMKDLGRLKYFLRTENGKLDCKPTSVPIKKNQRMGDDVKSLKLDRAIKKQTVMAQPSAEVEFRVVAPGVFELL
ncbi:hypothetical protein CR513_37551, partial [Mucuna pruriens]